jgi:hypothetical protein
MSSYTDCEVCLRATRNACSEYDSKRAQNEAVLRCPNSCPEDKLEAMENLGFLTDWIKRS